MFRLWNLESRGKHLQEDHPKKPFKPNNNHKSKKKDKSKKTATAKKEGGKLHCKHCDTNGHDEESCWKLHLEQRPKHYGGKKKKNTVATAQRDLGSDSGDETRITAMGMQGNKSPHTGSSSSHVSKENDKRRSELFHIRVVSKHTKIETLFDPGSQVNLISESVVNKLGIQTKPHPKPYPLGWVCDNC